MKSLVVVDASIAQEEPTNPKRRNLFRVIKNVILLQAELIDLRTELVNSKTRQEVLEEDSRSLLLQLHSLQLDRLPSNQNPEQYKEKIETALKLSPSKSSYSDEITFRNNSEVKKLKNELLQYQSENIILRNSILALNSEVYGARLAAKYLDKELAGRIQQLQLLGKEMRTDVRDRLWRQLESEILLHRHKTVIRACRNRSNHDFFPLDSRILNFNHTDERYIKNDGILRRGDSLFRFEKSNNRKKEYDVKKPKQQVREPAKRNSITIKNGNNSDTKNSVDEDDDDDNINNNNKNNSNNINSEDPTENEREGGSYTKVNVENDVDLQSGVSSVQESPQNNYGKIRTIDACINGNVDAKSPENGTEEKTDEEISQSFKTEGKDSKGARGRKIKSVTSDGEDFLCVVGEKRTVVVKRKSGQGLGISITGGREHGVPILISELEVGGPAYECKNLFVGDAILSVNDISLENSSHFEAVKILTNLETNNVNLVVQFIAVDTDEENSLSEDLYGYRYRFFDTEVMDSSDALGLHPVHSKSAHTPTAPRTPEVSRNGNFCQPETQTCKSRNSSASDEVFVSQSKTEKEVDESPEGKQQNLIDIDTEISKEDSEKLKIDLFGFRFQTDMHDVLNCSSENLIDDFLVKKPDPIKTEADLIQIEITDSKSPVAEKKFEYVDENIFSGLEDHSILDNIMKSFSEDDYSYLDAEKEKNLTSDSGLEVCLSGSDADNDAEKCSPDGNKNYLNDWIDNVPEKVELKTLQQIFDRSFSSNLSSPRGSTSFDDDILSTEHSDEKSNTVCDYKNKGRDSRYTCNMKKIQKCPMKSASLTEEILRKSFGKVDPLTGLKSDPANSKKVKRTSSDIIKRSKSGRKTKETGRKDVKLEKRKNSKELEGELPKPTGETHKKREVNFKVTDRFEENLIEYNVKNFDVSQLSPGKENCLQTYDATKKVEFTDEVSDELEETRKLSRRYGLKIPGKGVKADGNNLVVMPDVTSPERSLKVLEGHFKHFKPMLDGSARQNEKESKTLKFRGSRYESFGDPDFGTPV
ncbi:hypothetical protein RUM44_013554 [Polyplax serrata]|uniref:PDZ domain-containing protein n=1 Tax=Polyplax serrata TaxID=468196 RepID=A0ABR1BEH6_POLSC